MEKLNERIFVYSSIIDLELIELHITRRTAKYNTKIFFMCLVVWFMLKLKSNSLIPYIH